METAEFADRKAELGLLVSVAAAELCRQQTNLFGDSNCSLTTVTVTKDYSYCHRIGCQKDGSDGACFDRTNSMRSGYTILDYISFILLFS